MNTVSQVVAGVDTHKDVHVAAVLTMTGQLLGVRSFANDRAGHDELQRWIGEHGQLDRIGIEGTGSYGAGLTATLHERAVTVWEVSRPNRQRRRRHGKSDSADAEAAARAVLAMDMVSIPKTRDGDIEAIRVLRNTRDLAVRQRTQLANQIHALIDTAPVDLHDELARRPLNKVIAIINTWPTPAPPTDPGSSHRWALVDLVDRWQHLGRHIHDINEQLDPLVATTAPELIAVFGVGTDTAATLLITVGDNPDRIHNESAFAALCGVSPVDRSSGRQHHHSLNRGGDRRANNALWRIAMVRMRHDPRTRAYVQRRTTDGLTKKQIIRCLKRYIARELYPLLITTNTP